jgi:peptidoglycan hydrolase-like protein with peptidoglycan-binding domain/3D (Asp-Asp-Asp) domain-containing protein
MYIEFLKLRVYPAVVIMTSMSGSLFSPVYATERSREQTFVVTAYYSPLPDQCCYFRGNYEDEITFNGRGIAGADGTPVYPGMIAAPATYPFGTVIELPGIGVGTVHDRGGRIIEWNEDRHRIDLWMGYGEEGLARAMAWGVRTVKGTVHPAGGRQPAENWALERFDADSALLASLPKTDPVVMLSDLKAGERGYAVRQLQQMRKDEGYFSETPNGYFGPATQAALKTFQSEYGLSGDGTASDDDDAAALIAAAGIKDGNLPMLLIGLEQGMQGPSVRQAQKLLRYTGYYRGRTDGVFDQDLKEAVTRFQIDRGIVQSATDTGAGRIGPATRAAILQRWKAEVVSAKAKRIAAKASLAQRVKSEDLPKKTLSSGDRGKEVALLQSFLARAGYLPQKDVTGTFGSRTKAALLQYQMDRGIVTASTSKGAGVFGPSTRLSVSRDLIDLSWRQVRAGGLSSL